MIVDTIEANPLHPSRLLNLTLIWNASLFNFGLIWQLFRLDYFLTTVLGKKQVAFALSVLSAFFCRESGTKKSKCDATRRWLGPLGVSNLAKQE